MGGKQRMVRGKEEGVGRDRCLNDRKKKSRQTEKKSGGKWGRERNEMGRTTVEKISKTCVVAYKIFRQRLVPL